MRGNTMCVRSYGQKSLHRRLVFVYVYFLISMFVFVCIYMYLYVLLLELSYFDGTHKLCARSARSRGTCRSKQLVLGTRVPHARAKLVSEFHIRAEYDYDITWPHLISRRKLDLSDSVGSTYSKCTGNGAISEMSGPLLSWIGDRYCHKRLYP